MSNEYYILYGTKDNEIYYISNTNPIIWCTSINEAKMYKTRYTPEYEILRDYENYRAISKKIELHTLDSLFIAKVVNNVEVGRVKLI